MVPSNITSTSATLEWDPPPDANGIIVMYEVEYGPVRLDDNILRCWMGVVPITTVNTTDTSLIVFDLSELCVF